MSSTNAWRTMRKCCRRSKAALELGVYILSLRKMGRWKSAEKEHKEGVRAPGSAQLTTISSQQAVEGSFPVIPKKTSSVPTCCLNEISYLPKRSHCLITLQQETKGDSGSQRTGNPPHTVSSFAVSLQGSNPSALCSCSEP